jgi:hypothetical protein
MLDTSPDAPTYQALHSWVYSLFSILLAYVVQAITVVKQDLTDYRTRIPEFSQRLDDLERRPQTQDAAPPTQPARARKGKCKRCHAFGHDEKDCRTKDPEVMKRRVAKNEKLKKRTPVIPPPMPPPIHYATAPYPTPASPVPDSYIALFTDATEMRRRNAQSTRDKRKARRRAAVA